MRFFSCIIFLIVFSSNINDEALTAILNCNKEYSNEKREHV